MGRLVKDSTISAQNLISGNSPVLTELNSQFSNTLYVAKNGSDSMTVRVLLHLS